MKSGKGNRSPTAVQEEMTPSQIAAFLPIGSPFWYSLVRQMTWVTESDSVRQVTEIWLRRFCVALFIFAMTNK